MAAPAGASSITVAVRVRPFTIREAAQLVRTDDGPMFIGDGSLAAAPTPKLSQKGIRPIIKVVDDKCLVFDPPENNPMQKFSRSVVPQGKRVKDQTFMFDRVFDENTTQSDVYEATTKNLLDSVLDGYNATVFAYGATGCGKTHTITGTAQQPGIIFLTMQELFERITERQEEKVVEITLSYLEIYNETIRDLLVPGGSKQGLMLREDSNQAVAVAGLTSLHPQNVQEVMDIIVQGNELRTMSPTEANATSSRSHAVLQINVSQKDRNAPVNEPYTMATLSIIDLAGSERASATKNRGERLLEGANINKSLLALGSCINALCDPRKRNHVPYRNSKLTRLLKFSLGGNCRTVMVVCVSPSSVHFDETQNTLRYANRAKNIQTKVTRNVYNVNRHVKDFLKKIDEQMTLINELKQQQKDYEGTAFTKFRKQAEKREGIAREGIARIRLAYEHSAQERTERVAMMKKLRLVERRISLISTWVAGFDTVCETREEEEPPAPLVAMRKTASGILSELESSRQHYHQRLSKTNWDRALDTALQIGIRQLKEGEHAGDSAADIANLVRETELHRSMADREAYTAVLDQDKGGDAGLVQVLLQAHFDTIAILSQIMQMSEEQAVQAARKLLGQIVNACTVASSQVIKPEGGLPVTEAFPPSKMGTPKHRKQVNIMGPSPLKAPRLSMLEASVVGSPIRTSPLKNSPRRRKLGAAKKGVVMTPSRKSPVKAPKRAVRWKDDAEDGPLVEFQPTPKQMYSSSPAVSSVDAPPPPSFTIPSPLRSHINNDDDDDSSPMPPPPESSEVSTHPRLGRFQAGFLSKRSDGGGSPIGPPPVLNTADWSDSDNAASPLRELEPNRVPQPSALSGVDSLSPTQLKPVPRKPAYLRTSSASPTENARKSSIPTSSPKTSHTQQPPSQPPTRTASNTPASTARNPTPPPPPSSTSQHYSLDRSEAKQVRSALRRSSSAAASHGPHAASVARAHRRRSPTASSASGSPPLRVSNGSSGGVDGSSGGAGGGAPERLFSVSQARRMGGAEARGSLASVLSPRSAPVVKHSAARRTTVSASDEGRAQAVNGSGGSGGSLNGSARVGPVRMSSAVVGSAGSLGRGSYAPVSKGVWR